jgi:hypothetical protein
MTAHNIGFIVVCALLGSWFVASAVSQPGWRWNPLRSWDVLGLIPAWRMFTPRPDTEDYYVLYRDRLPDGCITPWSEAYPIPRRRWFHVFWNPDKHIRKLLSHVIRGFAIELDEAASKAPDSKPIASPMSGPYLAVLYAISNVPRLGGEATQFLILRHDAFAGSQPIPLIASSFHRL